MYPLVTSTIYWICSSLQTWNKFKTSLIRGWDPPIWKNMKQKWKCSPILEQENLSVTKLPHELVSSPEKTYWGLIYKCYKSQKNLMRLQFKQSPLVLMKNSHVSSAKNFQNFPRVSPGGSPVYPLGQRWRQHRRRAISPVKTCWKSWWAAVSRWFQCFFLREKRMAEINDIQNNIENKKTRTRTHTTVGN